MLDPSSPQSMPSKMKEAEKTLGKMHDAGYTELDQYQTLLDAESRSKLHDFSIEVARIRTRLHDVMELCDYKSVKGPMGTYSFKPSVPKEKRDEAIEALKETITIFNRATQAHEAFNQHQQAMRDALPETNAWEKKERADIIRENFGGRKPSQHEMILRIEEHFNAEGISTVNLLLTLNGLRKQEEVFAQTFNTLAICTTGLLGNLQGQQQNLG